MRIKDPKNFFLVIPKCLKNACPFRTYRATYHTYLCFSVLALVLSTLGLGEVKSERGAGWRIGEGGERVDERLGRGRSIQERKRSGWGGGGGRG